MTVDTEQLRDDALLVESITGWTYVPNRIRASAEEINRLRAVIADAPHGNQCWLGLPGDAERQRCTCWKSRIDKETR